MSLSTLITPSRLETLADYGYERGLKYWRDGRVLWCSQVGEMIEGEVSGKETYQVRVREYAKKLHWQCSCPIEGPMCKHVVALCLQFSSAGSTSAAPLEPVVPVPPPPVDGFETTTEAIAWVKAHDVEHELATSALVLLPTLFDSYRNETGLHYMLARLTLRDVASMEVASRFLGVRQLHRPAIAAARAYFARAAKDVRVGLAEEATRPDRPPAHALAAAAALWTALLDVRLDLRKTAVPRSRATRAAGKLEFDPRGLRLTWEERAIAKASLPGVGLVATSLALSPTRAALCSCKQPCTHLLALIDSALDLLADPEHTGEATRIAEEMMRPAWQRALAAFALVPDAEPAAAPPVEVWWEIDELYGTPTLAPVVRKPLKRGGWSGGTRTTPQKLLGDHAAVLDERDAKIAEHIASWVPIHRASTYPARAFAALVGHPRVRLADGEQVVSVKRFPLGFSALPLGEAIRIEPAVDGARFSPRLLVPLLQTFAQGEPLLVVEPEHERIMLIDVSEEARVLWGALDKHGDAFPPEAHDQLLEQLSRLERRLPVSVPQQLKGALRAEQMTVVLRVRMTPESALEMSPWIRPAPGAMLFPVAAGPRDVLVVHEGQRGYVRRDLATEHERVRAALARLPLGDAEEGPPLSFQIKDADAALALVAILQDPPPGLEAEWIDRTTRVVGRATTQALQLKIERRRDWFGIEGQLVIEAGRLELAKLLDAARHQRKFVRLDEDRWVELTEQLRKRLVAIADQTYTTRNDLELSPGAVPAIRDALAEGVTVQQPPAWEDLATRLASSLKLRPKPPASLVETLRPYQIEGHAWLSRVAAWGAGACLADDMGLGKTVQAIAVLIDRAKLGPALVLAPTSVTLNWVDELNKFAPKLVPVIYADAPDRAQCLAKLKKGDVLIASYGLLARDAELLGSMTFGTLVLDEAQAIKNPATQRTKAARRLRADFRIALSGTPVENNLGELWSLFSVVFPGLLGSWEQFRERYAFPIERQDSATARAGLSRVIRPFLLRRTKGEVARDLPSRTEIQVPIALSAEELAIYEDARLVAVSHLAREVKTTRDERQRFQVLAALTKLRLIASHPRLHDPASPVASSKMQRLLELLDELRAAGHRALVFSQFTSHLALVQPELKKAGISWLYLDGSTPTKQRKVLIEKFQGGEGDVFLLSLKAGGTGVNLTAADYVIHLDPWWNPAVEDQATDRAHRIGQTKPVTVYRLISRGTVEERIQQMHHGKRALIAGVLDGTDAAAKLTTRDLMSLLAETGS